MEFWKSLSIRKKLTYSILALTALLALTAGLVSGLRLPALPPSVRDASFLLLVEFAPVPVPADSLA